MICGGCGTELPDTALFCGECGRSLVARGEKTPRAARGRAAKRVPEPAAEPLPEPTAEPRPEPTAKALPEPAAEPLPEPTAEPPAAPEPPADPDESAEETRVVARSQAAVRFMLQFSTGESAAVTGSGLVGRNPSPEPGEYVDHLVPIVDATKSVSKTHLEFGQADGFLWILDRFSGNGTTLTAPDDRARQCEPGRRYRAPRGSRVTIGDQFFIVV